MSVIWGCGFEAGGKAYYELAGWTFTGASTDVLPTVPHKIGGNGGNYSLLVHQGALSTHILGNPLWLHYWMSPAHPSFTKAYDVRFLRIGTATASVKFKTDGRVQIWRGSSFTGLFMGQTGYIDPTVPHWVSIELIATTTGRMTVYIDGFAVLQYSGDLQEETALAGWDQIEFYRDTDGPSTCWVYIDDIVVTDGVSEKLPDHLVIGLFPDGDSAPLELTPSTPGTHFSLVNEIPPSAAEYNEANAVDLEDNYDVNTLGWTPTYISFVSLSSYAVRDGAISGARHIVTTASANPGSFLAYAAAGYWAVATDLWDVDPDDSNPWTKLKLDTMKIGIEFRA